MSAECRKCSRRFGGHADKRRLFLLYGRQAVLLRMLRFDRHLLKRFMLKRLRNLLLRVRRHGLLHLLPVRHHLSVQLLALSQMRKRDDRKYLMLCALSAAYDGGFI